METEALWRLWRSPAVIETVKTIVYALLIVSVILTFIFRPYVIPSSSMKDTLLVGDYVFVTKFSYGYSKYSFFFSPNLFSGRIWGAEPERGDVVVFRKPSQPDVDYIKRVVGLPGDRVQMIGGVLNINGEPVKMKKVEPFEEEESDCNMQQPVPRYRETLPGGVVHDILDCDPQGRLDDTQEFVVPPGHYFMMGDNRDNSADSRDLETGVGFVPEENLVGKAQFIIVSAVCYDDQRCKARIWNFGNGPGPFATSGSLSLSNNQTTDDLGQALGHAFGDAALLKRALTHSSTGKDDNEQLEFLGDRVLGLLVAELLMQQFPHEREGPLSVRLHALVRMDTCAEAAKAAGLDRHLILAPSEDRSGGRKKPAILGDVCEAVIAALYIDGGLNAARNFVVRYWQPLLNDAQADRDAKSVLQEWAQARALGIPVYRIAKQEGPAHAPRFTVEVRVEAHEPAIGEGPNLRAAEQSAARALMQRLNV